MSGNRQCVRPGCGGAVAALLSYDYAGQRIWLDDPDAETGGHQSALCAAHASRLRAPRGWSCQDRRIVRVAPTFRARAPSTEPREAPATEAGAGEPDGGGGAPVPGAVDPVVAAAVAVPAGASESEPPPHEAAAAQGVEGRAGQPDPVAPEQAAADPVPPQRDGGVIAGLTAIAV